MATGDLTTLANAQIWVPALDAVTGPRLITAASTSIQKWLGYQVASASYSLVLDGPGRRKIFLPVPQITAVASVVVGGLSIPAGTLPSAGAAAQSGYFFNTKSITLLDYCFDEGVQNVAVTYTAGYTATPLDIEQACLDFVKVLLERQQRVADAVEMKAGGSSIKYDDADTNGGPIPTAIRTLIQPYVRTWQWP